jgi:hypothetical protein
MSQFAIIVTRNGQYVGERDAQDLEGVVNLLNTYGSTYATPGVVVTIRVTADPEPEGLDFEDYEDEDFDEDESDENDETQDDVVELLKGIASGIGDLVSAVRNIVR